MKSVKNMKLDLKNVGLQDLTRRLNTLCGLSVIGHCFFLLGTVMIVLFANTKNQPISLESIERLKVIIVFLAGYVFVFFGWVRLSEMNERYSGNAVDVPAYLTQKLFGQYPYLFTFGRSNYSNATYHGNTTNYKVHTYTTSEVMNKKFTEVFSKHVSKKVSYVLAITSVFMPILIFGKPSSIPYIQLLFQHIYLFVPYMYLILITWLSTIMILVFRLYVYLTEKI